jgi:thiol-disulfide isomerase/thioredoxin
MLRHFKLIPLLLIFGWIVQIEVAVQAFDNTNRPEAESTAPDRATGSLHLIGGDVYRGQISTNTRDGNLVWRCPAFVSDLSIPWESVERLSQPFVAQPADSSPSDFVFELLNGETFTGRWNSLLGGNLLAESVEVQSELGGIRSFAMADLRSILRVVPVSASDTGSLPVDQWAQVVPAIRPKGRSKWYSKNGTYNTETAGTSIRQKVHFPDMAAIDIDVAWDQATPNWMVTIGEPRRLELHFRKLETRNMVSVTLLVDDDVSADVATALIPSDGLKAISLRVRCDCNRGRFVLMKGDTALAQLRLPKPILLSGLKTVTFTNIGSGLVSLRDVKIYTSIFTAPTMQLKEGQTDPTSPTAIETLLISGQSILGTPSQFDPATRTFGISNGSVELSRVPIDQVVRIEFPGSSIGPVPRESIDVASPTETGVPNETGVPVAPAELVNKRPLYQIDLISGARYCGQTIFKEASSIVLKLERTNVTVAIPISQIVGIGLTSDRTIKSAWDGVETETGNSANSKLMWLTSSWATSLGSIDRVDPISVAEGTDKKPALFWKPQMALEAVAFSSSLSGTIEPMSNSSPDKKEKASYGQIKKGQKEPDNGRPLESNEPSLFLTNGDCFPAVLELLDETKTVFHSQIFESNQIDNALIRGIRVLAYSGTDQMDKALQKRLLTLPRTQRNNPPTHLIIARQGDVIRGKLKSLNSDFAVIDVRGSDRKILMKTVAEIVWLTPAPEVLPLSGKALAAGEPENLSGKALAAGEPNTSTPDPVVAPDSNPNRVAKESDVPEQGSLQCQALFDSGTRISMIPSSVMDNVLFGQHPRLGACQIDLSLVARLVIGDAIMAEAQRNRLGKWRLENAPDPKFVNDLDSPEGADDQTQPMQAAHAKMVGQPAPLFDLERLNGGSIKLADLRGKIVVLDFWATWCGPCVASLPKLNDIAQEYRGVNVELVTVNLEQTQDEIKTMLERLNIQPTVVIDSDASVAKSYQAKAIPQTVIIDSQGKIVKIIVGGGEASERAIRTTLDTLTEAKL